LERKKNKIKIGFSLLNHIGDFLYALPTIYNAYKNLENNVEIYLFGKKHLKAYLPFLPFKVNFLEREKFFKDLNKIKGLKLNYFFHIHQSIYWTFLSFLAKIPNRVGFKEAPFNFLYTDNKAFKNGPSSCENFLKLISNYFKIEKKDYYGLLKRDNNFSKIKKKKNTIYIGFAPFSTEEYRSYPKENLKIFIKIFEKEFKNKNIFLVLFGSKEQKIEVNSKKVINLIGKTSLLELISTIADMDYFISVDTGPLHIALSMKIKTIGIFGKTDPKMIIPYSKYFYPLYKILPCSFCWGKIKCRNFVCLKRVYPIELIKTIKYLILGE